MRTNKRILIVGMIASVLVLSGCHGSAATTYKMRWVSSTENQNVLEFKMDGPTVLGRIHMVIFRQRVKGTYVLKSGDITTQGRVIQDGEGYTLVSDVGKEQRFSNTENRGFLKDESGTVWKPDNPVEISKTLSKW